MGQLALTPPADRTLFWAIARATFCAAAAFPCALLLWAGAVREEMSLPNESIKKGSVEMFHKSLKLGTLLSARLDAFNAPEFKAFIKADGRKVKGTIHWVSALKGVEADVRLYDRLFLSLLIKRCS